MRVESIDPYFEKREDDMLVGFGEDGEAFLIGKKDAGWKDGCFDGFTQPLFHHSFWRHVRSNFNSCGETKTKEANLYCSVDTGVIIACFIHRLLLDVLPRQILLL